MYVCNRSLSLYVLKGCEKKFENFRYFDLFFGKTNIEMSASRRQQNFPELNFSSKGHSTNFSDKV